MILYASDQIRSRSTASPCNHRYRFALLARRRVAVSTTIGPKGEVLDLIVRRKLAILGVGDVVVSWFSPERANHDTEILGLDMINTRYPGINT